MNNAKKGECCTAVQGRKLLTLLALTLAGGELLAGIQEADFY